MERDPDELEAGVPVVDLIVSGPDGSTRRREPVTCGIPWPRGSLHDIAQLTLRDHCGRPIPLQSRVLDSWPDRSIRWTLLDWQADAVGEGRFQLAVGPAGGPPAFDARVTCTIGPRGGVTVETGAVTFRMRPGREFPFVEALDSGGLALDVARTRLTATGPDGAVFMPWIRNVIVEEDGPLRVAVRLEGELVGRGPRPLAEVRADLHFFAGSAVVRFDVTLRNPRRAGHPGGLWDLGDRGSIYFEDVSLTLALPSVPGPARIGCSPEPGMPSRILEPPAVLYQDSSGGQNWKGTNHVNRDRVVPNRFRGYRLRGGGTDDHAGLRATPVVTLELGGRFLAMAMGRFWQNFPKAIEATGDALVLHIFPGEYAAVHELQGGEQKTHSFFAAFGPDEVTDEPLAWCRAPMLPRAQPPWYCESGVHSYLVPRSDDTDLVHRDLIDSAIEGDDTFERKREIIDEYGWRHFGDVYGDHEAAFHKGPTPLVSHYNNQYDNIAGFAYQFFRSGDARWWAAMDELARHVFDIDLYHTDRDKSAYNRGMFWHTCHYVDADTGTHRSYPRAGGVCGGGPSGGHLYTSGLMFHHFLTGESRSRESVIELAQWVIDADDGRKTIFRWLDRGPTGHPTASGTADYHGPGRAPANSIDALVNGHRLTGDPAMLDKAEQIILRCIHPSDDIVGRNLLDAENKWFYTMFLQALGRYLDYKIESGAIDRMYAFARASLLHYARWMVDNEYPYLEKPHLLEYPTETWAAQDIRKSDVFLFAAKHSTGEERGRFLERSGFFSHYATTTLAGMKSRTLARPLVLLLANGLMRAHFDRHPGVDAPLPDESADFGRPVAFVPQKARAKKRSMITISIFTVIVSLIMIIYISCR